MGGFRQTAGVIARAGKGKGAGIANRIGCVALKNTHSQVLVYLFSNFVVQF